MPQGAQSRTPPPKSAQASLANQTRTPSLKSCQRVFFSQPLVVEPSPTHAQSRCPRKQSGSCSSQTVTRFPQSSSPDLPSPPKRQKTQAAKQPYTQSSPASTSSHKRMHSRCVIELSDTTTDEDTPSPPKKPKQASLSYQLPPSRPSATNAPSASHVPANFCLPSHPSSDLSSDVYDSDNHHHEMRTAEEQLNAREALINE
ncbi:hypothetical protein O181_087370 [Austropuccinia psidii MF-1]|uniref:Uncharacterized protein n=1 Tax=Austropuccinia psidii MF-1 TaxID=1389203 RepID=A0A9Q3P1R9_9BASI|nr:hypothetical protein [Austropuccinia psidii MF-1]